MLSNFWKSIFSLDLERKALGPGEKFAVVTLQIFIFRLSTWLLNPVML